MPILPVSERIVEEVQGEGRDEHAVREGQEHESYGERDDRIVFQDDRRGRSDDGRDAFRGDANAVQRVEWKDVESEGLLGIIEGVSEVEFTRTRTMD